MNAQTLNNKAHTGASTPLGKLPTLRDKVALVSGASSGIGKAIALGLAQEGARLWLVGRNSGALEEVAKTALETSPAVRVCRADWTHDDEVHAMAEAVESSGPVDVLVVCGGEIHHAKLANACVADLDAQYRANVRGPYLLTQALLPALRVGPGQIVFINSSSGLKAPARAGQYAATQHAMKAVAESLRDEINADGIRVLNVFLGRTATGRTEELFREEGKAYRPELLMQPEDVALMVIHALKLPRTAEVTEISMRSLVKSY